MSRARRVIVKGGDIMPGSARTGTAWMHGRMPYVPPCASDTGEDRLFAHIWGDRPTRAQRRLYSGAITRVEA